jgi:hypothetical protein
MEIFWPWGSGNMMNPVLCMYVHILEMCVHTAGMLDGSFDESEHFCTSLNDFVWDQDVITYTCYTMESYLR